MTENASIPDLSPQLQIVYKDAIDNIMFVKREQWIITNYLIAALAGVYAINSGLKNIHLSEKIILTIAVLVAFSYFLWLLKKIWKGMTKFRRRVAWFNSNRFSPKLLEELELSPDPKPPETDIAFRTCIIWVGIFGFAVVIYSIWRESLPTLVSCLT
ncbi:MAG: hypothetical protein O6924_10170 [Alphaproteobacteria bacterium]|nr:hypothetical protein [Alphaproteobacteria bacterium]